MMNNALSVLENELIRLKELMDKCLVESIKTNKNLEIAIEALEFECGNRCAHQNPCNAREALTKIKELDNETNKTNS